MPRSHEERIARRLGVTPAGLDCLCRAVARGGLAEGEGFMRGQGARGRLERQGLIEIAVATPDPSVMPGSPAAIFMAGRRGQWLITDAGRSIVALARQAGY